MARLSINEVTTYRWTLEEDVRHYVAAGFEAMGAWRQKMADYGEEQAVDLIAESGLRVSNLLWAGGFTGSDGRSLEEGVRDTAHAIRLAGALNAGCLVIYPGGRNNHTYRHAERLLRIALNELLEFAEAADVVLAIEPMHPACAAEWTFLADLESTLALIESYRTPLLKLVFDTYHFGHDRPAIANLAELAPHIGVVHLANRIEPHSLDQNRSPLAEGRLPLAEIVRSLMDAGYAGYFDVELIGSDFDHGDYASVLKSSQEFFDRILAPVSGG